MTNTKRTHGLLGPSVLGALGVVLVGAGLCTGAATAQDQEAGGPEQPQVRLSDGPLGNALPQERRATSAAILQEELRALIDLQLKAKHLHWTVVGPGFRPLHEQFDEIAELAGQGTDTIAERMLALGAAPDGRADAVAGASALPDVPEGFISDEQAVEVAARLLQAQSERLYAQIDRLDEVDLVSQDLLVDLAHQLDKHLWMLEAQLMTRSERAK